MEQQTQHPNFDVKIQKDEGVWLQEDLIELAITRNGMQWYTIGLYPVELAKVAEVILKHLIDDAHIS